MGFVLSLLILLAVVVVHEFGHYLVMRRNGVPIEEFSIGIGPPLFQRKMASGTVLSLRCLPLIGYVKPVPAPDDNAMKGASAWERSISRWARFKIYMAGMFFNSVAGFLAMAVAFYATGKMPVFLAEWCMWAPVPLQPLIGAFIGSFGIWLATPVLIVVLAVKMGAAFFKGTSGPLGIVMMGNAVAAADVGFGDKVFALTMFFAMLNGAIAGFNLLPFFPLDGGHVAGLLIEKITGKFDSATGRRYRVGTTIFMLLLFVVIILSDFVKALVPASGG